ncbi:MAG: (Fe-S)-binding protein [Syntrophorhabdus sp.]
MYSLQFDTEKCLHCQTQDCLMKCQYIELDRKGAREEIVNIIRGKDSFVLHECVTCYGCEEYCPMGNHPFYLIVECQEAFGIAPAPRPIVRRAVNLGLPFRGKPQIKEIHGPVLNMGAFSELTRLIEGKLFEGLPVISTDGRKMFHYFCQLMYLHYGKSSVIKERLPGVIDIIASHKPTEVICFHDECYGTYTSYCSAVGIKVPFTPVHFFEYLYNRLVELKDLIEPVDFKVAYQRPCSSRLSPEKHRFAGEIFRLIGANEVARDFVDENALCCGGTIQGQRREGSRKRAAAIQKKNVDDMKRSGVEVCVFNCPACFNTLGGIVAREGIRPVYMSDLCRFAIGETPYGWR